MSRLISLRRAEADYGLPYVYLYAAVVDGRLPAINVAREGASRSAYRVDPADVEALIATEKAAR